MDVMELEAVRDYLENERNRLCQELQTEENHLRSPQLYNPYKDRGESAMRTQERSNQVARSGYIKGRIAEIERALEKMDEGTYGKCESCGQPIPIARLRIMPQAVLCPDCKARKELGGKR